MTKRYTDKGDRITDSAAIPVEKSSGRLHFSKGLSSLVLGPSVSLSRSLGPPVAEPGIVLLVGFQHPDLIHVSLC